MYYNDTYLKLLPSYIIHLQYFLFIINSISITDISIPSDIKLTVIYIYVFITLLHTCVLFCMYYIALCTQLMLCLYIILTFVCIYAFCVFIFTLYPLIIYYIVLCFPFTIFYVTMQSSVTVAAAVAISRQDKNTFTAASSGFI